MTISNIVTRKLLVAALALVTISTFSLDAMKRQRDESTYSEKPTVVQEHNQNSTLLIERPLFETYLWCCNLGQNMPDECKLLLELNKYIIFIYKHVINNVITEEIIQNCKRNSNFLSSIRRAHRIFGSDFAIKLVGKALKEYCLHVGDFNSSPKPDTILINGFKKIEITVGLMLNEATLNVDKNNNNTESFNVILGAVDEMAPENKHQFIKNFINEYFYFSQGVAEDIKKIYNRYRSLK